MFLTLLLLMNRMLLLLLLLLLLLQMAVGRDGGHGSRFGFHGSGHCLIAKMGGEIVAAKGKVVRGGRRGSGEGGGGGGGGRGVEWRKVVRVMRRGGLE